MDPPCIFWNISHMCGASSSDAVGVLSSRTPSGCEGLSTNGSRSSIQGLGLLHDQVTSGLACRPRTGHVSLDLESMGHGDAQRSPRHGVKGAGTGFLTGCRLQTGVTPRDTHERGSAAAEEAQEYSRDRRGISSTRLSR